MIMIRLSRFGRKLAPFYRVVAIDGQKKREGEPLEVLGFWNPVTREFKVEREKLKIWVTKGAQISPTVSKLLETPKTK